jgi:methyl-accepting chemotaxis protein
MRPTGESMSSNMHVAAKGVSDITADIREICSATESIDAATKKVKEASRALA